MSKTSRYDTKFEIASFYYRKRFIYILYYLFYLTTLVIEIIPYIILVRFIIKYCIYKNQAQLYFFF